MLKKLLPAIFAVFIATICADAKNVKVDHFKATADGKTNNLEAIQKAIDECSATGGGEVLFSEKGGVYLSGGPIVLKNNVTLRIPRNVTLKAIAAEAVTKGFIYSRDVENIGITGGGTIDGSGGDYIVKDGAPKRCNLVLLENSKNIRVTDITLYNGATWTLNLLRCDTVFIDGIHIKAHENFNNDGIDIQSCQNVTISGCDIYTSDDAIVLKNRHPRYNIRPCANITVTNCILTCVCNAFKIGTETIGQFRNITFSNSTIRQAQPTDSLARIRVKDMNMPIRAISGISIESVDGSLVDGVAVSNITMENVRCPIFIRLANRGAGVQKKTPPVPGEVKNVVISGVTVRNAWYASSITAIPGCHVENVILRDIIVRMRGKKDPSLPEKTVDEKVDAYPDAHMWGDLPASAFFVRHADGIFMDNIVCNLDAEENRPVAIFEDVKHLSADGIYVDGKYVGESAFRLVRTSDARFSGCRVPDGVKFAVDMRGQENSCIRIEGMDPSRVRSEKSSQIQQIISFEVK